MNPATRMKFNQARDNGARTRYSLKIKMIRYVGWVWGFLRGR